MTVWQDEIERLRDLRRRMVGDSPWISDVDLARAIELLVQIDKLRCVKRRRLPRNPSFVGMRRCLLDAGHQGRCDFAKNLHTCRYCLQDMRCSAASFEENPFCRKCLHERMERVKPEGPIEWVQDGDYIKLVTRNEM